MAERLVLVVDDDAALRAVVADALATRLAVRVRAVPDGYDAIQAIGRQPPDLILLDLTMPSVDGFAVLRWLRGRGYRIPVLAMTDLGSEAAAHALARGCADCLLKPFAPTDLLAAVARQLRPVHPASAAENGA